MNAIPYEQQGRTGQKARTRAAIVDAAVELIERGEAATIDAAAALAGVGRGTAYRYFPNQRALLSAAYRWRPLTRCCRRTRPAIRPNGSERS